MKPWYKSKSLWMALVTIALALCDVVANLDIPAEAYGVLAALTAVLRIVKSNLTMAAAAVLAFAFVLGAGCAGTCDLIDIERRANPDSATGRIYVLKCGSTTTTMKVKTANPCLEGCFDPERPR